MAKKHWIQGAIKHPGAFTRKAQAAGMSVAGFAQKVLSGTGHYSAQTKRQANMYQTLRKMH